MHLCDLLTRSTAAHRWTWKRGAVIVALCATALSTTGCGCLTVVGFHVDPQATTLRVGQSFTPNATVTGCRADAGESWTWTANDTTVLRVEAQTGRATGLAPGNAKMTGQGTGPYGGTVFVSVAVVP